MKKPVLEEFILHLTGNKGELGGTDPVCPVGMVKLYAKSKKIGALGVHTSSAPWIHQ